MTEYKYRALFIASDKSAGNALALLAAPHPDDPDAEANTFTDSRTLSPSGYYAEMPAKQSLVDVIDAIKSGADYSDDRLAFLRERGLTVETWVGLPSIILACDWYEGEYQRDAMTDLATTLDREIVPHPETEL